MTALLTLRVGGIQPLLAGTGAGDGRLHGILNFDDGLQAPTPPA